MVEREQLAEVLQQEGRLGAVKPVTVVLGLGLFLAACGAEGSVTSDNEGSSYPQNEDSEARFPANQQIGPMNLHVP